MSFRKLIILLLMSTVLSQSVLAFSDMHLVFEETDTHHQHDNLSDLDLAEEDHIGDDCGHSCNTHSSNMFIFSKIFISFNEISNNSILMDDGSDYFYLPSSNLRPPIA